MKVVDWNTFVETLMELITRIEPEEVDHDDVC